MYRGTTPTLKFSLPFDVSFIDVVWVTFSQKNKEIFTIETEDCVLEEKTITMELTQNQTLRLQGKDEVEIQVRILTHEGEALASNIFKTTVKRILKDGEIS